MRVGRILAIPVVNELRSIHADFKPFYYSLFATEHRREVNMGWMFGPSQLKVIVAAPWRLT
jgi:hypothetical protein